MGRIVRFIVVVTWLFGALFDISVGAETIRYGMVEMPRSDGNPFTMVGPSGTMLWSGLFDALTVMEEDGSLQPAIATAWHQEDALTWRFDLRDDIVFHDGTPLTAEAVAATFAWLRTDMGPISMVGQEFLNVDSVEAPSRSLVRLRLRQPDAIFPVRASAVYIVEPRAWAQLGPEGFARTPVGTGSFMVDVWPSGGENLVMRASAPSWRPPKVDEIIVRVIPQAVSRAQALITGQVDVVESIAFDDVDMLRGAGLEVMASPTS